MGLVLAMAHVDAEGVGPGCEQPPHDVGVGAGGAEGGEDLDLAAARIEFSHALRYATPLLQLKDEAAP